MRPIDFVYSSSGVNRPLRPADDEVLFRNQINKVANAIKEIISGMKAQHGGGEVHEDIKDRPDIVEDQRPVRKGPVGMWKPVLGMATLLLAALLVWFFMPSSAGASLGENASIAVIPFNNYTNQEQYDNYGLGFSSEIRSQLAKSNVFETIISEQSTIRFLNKDNGPSEIAGQLDVDYLVIGNFQVSGEEMRVKVELIDKSGNVAWEMPPIMASFTDIGDLAMVQAKIADNILQQFSFTGDAEPRAYDAEPRAYEEYLEGERLRQEGWVTWEHETIALAKDHFLVSIKLDSGYFPTWRGLIQSYISAIWLHKSGFLVEGPKHFSNLKAVGAAMDFVMEHFDDDYEKLLLMAVYAYRVENDLDKAEKLYHEALSVFPNDDRSTSDLAAIYKRKLDITRALEYIRISVKNNPNDLVAAYDLNYLFGVTGDYSTSEGIMLNVWKKKKNSIVITKEIYEHFFNYSDFTKLPEEIKTRWKARYLADSLYLAKDWKSLLQTIDKLGGHPTLDYGDSLYVLYYLKSYAFKQLGMNDSSKRYATQGILRGNKPVDRGVILAMLYSLLGKPKISVEELHKSFTFDLIEGGDRWSLNARNKYEIAIYALSGEYEKATEFILEINRDFPEDGDYGWLHKDPLFDHIKKEHPPFQEALNNLKLPRKLSETIEMERVGY